MIAHLIVKVSVLLVLFFVKYKPLLIWILYYSQVVQSN